MPVRLSRTVGALPMQKLFVVPWLSPPCRILITFVIALVLVFSALAVLKISSRRKQPPVVQLITGSIQKSSTVGRSETKARVVSSLDPDVSQPSPRQLQTNRAVQGTIPLPRPRPKLK
jgi:hypothetical protein